MALGTTQNGNDWVQTLGTTAVEPFASATGGAKTPDANRDGVIITNCHASATIYVKMKGASSAASDLTTSRYSFKIGPGQWALVSTRDLFYLLSDTASTPVEIMEFKATNSGSGDSDGSFTVYNSGGGSSSFSGALAAGEAHIGEVGLKFANPTGTFTRPADTTAYAVNDLIANSTTAGSVAAMQLTASRVAAGNFQGYRVRLKKSTTTTGAQFAVYCYSSVPTCANGDNGAFSTTESGFLGKFIVSAMEGFTDGATGIGVPEYGSALSVALGSGQVIYCLVKALTAYTPGNAEVFTLTLEENQS